MKITTIKQTKRPKAKEKYKATRHHYHCKFQLPAVTRFHPLKVMYMVCGKPTYIHYHAKVRWTVVGTNERWSGQELGRGGRPESCQFL